MLAHPNETITWVDAEERLPRERWRVLLFSGDPVFGVGIGFHTDGEWVWMDHRPMTKVIAWAAMPQGPGKNETNNEGE